ncbi:G-protein coupled receptor moody [Hyalella azteca]|uniref:G-protein coupled receptor moody n=1 Tax=Hyalella azteca TaxID=294128 RepID=A0A8B7NEY4_HYAAZ|nr:G-protein coupled receptor moody [Hyalella azteca]
MSIAMITVNRYIMITQTASYSRIYRPVWVCGMIFVCWMFPLVMLFPTLLSSWGRFGFDPWLETCTILSTSGEHPKQVLFGLGFCVPAAAIVVCYSLIFKTVKESERRMLNHRRPSCAHAPQQSEKEIRRRRNEWRVTQMVLTIFVAFLVTYLPMTLIKTFDTKLRYPVLHVVAYVLIYTSCCVNPVIYVVMNKQYRQAYLALLLCRRQATRSFSMHSSGERRSAATYHPNVDKIDVEADELAAAVAPASAFVDVPLAGVFKQIPDI